MAQLGSGFQFENLRFLLFLVNESLDDMLEDSGDEEETNAIVGKVLDEIGIEMSEKVNYFIMFQPNHVCQLLCYAIN